jgi:hypothetical protein
MLTVNSPDDPRWPYLSPSQDGWDWVPGPRGHIRRLLTHESGEALSGAGRTVIVLDVLEGLDGIMRALDDDALMLVTEAYRRGASWADIAARLGRAKQTIHERYQARVRAERTEQLLLADVAQAVHLAVHTREHGTSPEAIAQATALLRRHATVSRGKRPK